MIRIRSIAYMICISAAILLLVSLAVQFFPPAPEHFTSVHPASTMSPMVGFAENSILNSGDAEPLDAFPGVGEVISQRIIDLRTSIDGYRIPEDLLLVKGIGEATLEKIMNALEEPLVVLQPLEE